MKNTVLHSIFLLISTFATAQVTLKTDTTHIRIGEQIQYEISTENTPDVQFPKLQLDSLGKVEVVHSLAVDTLKKRLFKKYILTSFDSGTYRIPAQKVFINKQKFLTDSLLIHVGTVVVDTTQQKLFPIKPIYKAPPKTWRDYLNYLWWFLGILSLIGFVWWFVSYRRKHIKKLKKHNLTPIQVAWEHFQTLDKKQLIEQQKIKAYYVELTEIVRDYIGKDVHIPTMEVTTDELITLLSIHNKSKKIGIDKERITQLHSFLQTADLVKFAKSKPELLQIQEDRQIAEIIINDIQAIVHKPVLDEFGKEVVVESKEDLKSKTTKKRRLIAVLIAVVLVLIIAISTVSYYGFKYVKDTFVGHPTKELLEGDWYHSSYGFPTIGLETPIILKAIDSDIPPEARQMLLSNANFSYGSLLSGFYVMLTTVEVQEQVPLEQENIITNTVKMIESQEGVRDFVYEEEEVTISENKGVKLTGTLVLNADKMQFEQYIFIKDNTLRQITIVRKKKDTYAKEIQERIEKSILIK